MLTIKRNDFKNIMALGVVAASLGCSSAPESSTTHVPAGSTSATIGAGGGTLTRPDGLVITFPSGALTEDVSMTASVDSTATLTPLGGRVVGFTYLLEPKGMTFLVPISIQFPIPAGTSAANLVVFTYETGSAVSELAITSQDATSVTASTLHFSDDGLADLDNDGGLDTTTDASSETTTTDAGTLTTNTTSATPSSCAPSFVCVEFVSNAGSMGGGGDVVQCFCMLPGNADYTDATPSGSGSGSAGGSSAGAASSGTNTNSGTSSSSSVIPTSFQSCVCPVPVATDAAIVTMSGAGALQTP